jgi:hypothetical protein
MELDARLLFFWRECSSSESSFSWTNFKLSVSIRSTRSLSSFKENAGRGAGPFPGSPEERGSVSEVSVVKALLSWMREQGVRNLNEGPVFVDTRNTYTYCGIVSINLLHISVASYPDTCRLTCSFPIANKGKVQMNVDKTTKGRIIAHGRDNKK